MKAINFPEQNDSIQPLTLNTNHIPLPVWTDGTCCISVWQLTDEDIKLLAEGKKLYVMVGAPPDSRFHPMIGLCAENIIPDNGPLSNLILPNNG